MAKWACKANKGLAAIKGVLYLQAAAAAMRRARVYDWTIGCGAAPADNSFVHIAQRCTTLPTGAALVPNALDPADALASTIVATDTVTVDGTLTANAFLARKALNQRASFRWVAAPGNELVIPATASNGIMFGLSAANASDMDYDAHYEEL